MPVSLETLESAIRTALPVQHLQIEDQSSGCGENYAITLVSEVCISTSISHTLLTTKWLQKAFEGKTTLARHRWSTPRFLYKQINSILITP